MANFDQLKQKYQPVLNAIQEQGGQVQALSQQGDQLVLTATVPDDNSKNRIWDAIKSVDPGFSDLKHNITVDSSLQAAAGQRRGPQTYTVQPGDSLSKISKQFYGDATRYMEIAKANGIQDPNKIKAGQELKIPA
jgi:nucleoid-associated protein YgaU